MKAIASPNLFSPINCKYPGIQLVAQACHARLQKINRPARF
jgi:hypothetical protein